MDLVYCIVTVWIKDFFFIDALIVLGRNYILVFYLYQEQDNINTCKQARKLSVYYQ